MGSDRDHFVLTTRRNRRFIQSAETYPVVKVRRAPGARLTTGTTEVVPPPSDPLVRGLPQSEGHGSGARCGTRSPGLDGDGVSGMGPELFSLRWRSDGGGGDEETRTPDPLLAKEMLYQLSYVPAPGGGMVGDSGLEPETSALSGQRSNQLS